MSLFNKKRKKFQEAVKAKERDRAGGGAGGCEAGSSEGVGAADKRKRAEPPKGHVGVSHSNKPKAVIRAPFESCGECGSARVEQLRACTKLVSDRGADKDIHTAAFIVGEGVCLDCGAESKADIGVLEGTSFGPVLPPSFPLRPPAAPA